MNFKFKVFKKSQIIIYSIAVLLMVAGYMNFVKNTKYALQTSSQDITNDTETADAQDITNNTETANIGDAQLVSSNIDQNGSEKNKESNENQSLDNSKIENQTSKAASANTDSEYFVKSKLERDKIYSQSIETYEKILNSNNSLETQKQSATQEITKINNVKNSIMVCENLLQTKGFDNSVIFVNGNNISVIIGTDELKKEEVAQIQNIISREMNAKIESIHITSH